MQIHVSQCYIEGGSTYRFSHIFQNYISEQISEFVEMSPEFISAYSENFELIFNMSAKAALKENEVLGPTIFNKDNDVEYSIFLPFDPKMPLDENKRIFALDNLFLGIYEVLEKYKFDVSKLRVEEKRIIDEIIANPIMNR